MGGRGDMTTAPISLQDLQQRIYVKAKAEPSWRFWGLYVHVCKMETLREAYRRAEANNGAPGSDGVTVEDIEASGVEPCLEPIRDALGTRTYRPMRVRQKAIPKEGGPKARVLSIPTSRDRVVQGAVQLIPEPLFAADFQPGSYGYRPQRSAHDAVLRVAEAIVKDKTRVIDVDVQAYFDHLRHHLLLAQVAQRVNDPAVLHGLKLRLQASGKKGVAQGGVLSPLLSNR
jgi:RNA-directed DNA polymerase